MTSAAIYMFTLAVISLHDIPIGIEATNSSILTMKLPEDTEPSGGLDNIIYSFLGADKEVLNEYIQIVHEIFKSEIFNENLKFLKEIKLKCLPKLYLRLRKIKPSDFINCQKLHTDLIDAFGNRILEACKKADSILKCLTEARRSLTDKYEDIEGDIVEIYLNEVIGGKNTCIGDILKQLKNFSDLVQKECR